MFKAGTRAAGFMAAALVAMFALTGCSSAATAGDSTGSGATASATVDAGPDTLASIQAPGTRAQTPVYEATLERLEEQRVAKPVRLAVADLGLDMDVTDVGILDDGTLEIPDSAAVAGWWRAGAAPGQDEGVALLAAHVDDPSGLGPFAALKGVSEGAEVDVTLDDGTIASYRVSAVEQTSKETVDFDRVLDGTPGHQLVLVTCGGEFDWNTRHYDDNVIVWAERVDV
ncbi:class F sortase [Demequina aurantiaca]|uniref:class F sortase n=1 Tax=Demequina aurantiaca TaxID=676200 RepID=UPI003D3460EF